MADSNIPAQGVTDGIVTAGITAGSVVSTSGTASGDHPDFNYTLVIQVPIPFVSINVAALIGALETIVLTKLHTPKATIAFIKKAQALIQNIIADAIRLIRAIPEATVTILVKAGPAVITSIELVAQKVPVTVPIPTFDLGLLNLALDPNITLAIPFPAPPPTIIEVPIPVPILPNTPLIAGGIELPITAGVAATPQPVPVKSPIKLPAL
jgi:hypothetical protein